MNGGNCLKFSLPEKNQTNHAGYDIKMLASNHFSLEGAAAGLSSSAIASRCPALLDMPALAHQRK
jgi:hypothetical protein